MATLYIAEYATIPALPNHPGQVPLDPPLIEQTLTIGGVATSQPFQPTTRLVRLHCDAVCSLILNRADKNPVATTANARFAANQTEYRGVPEGQNYVVSVIANT